MRGWQLINGPLQPVLTQLPEPEKQLTLISSNCKVVVSDPVAERSQVFSVRFYVVIDMKMAAALLKKQSFFIQSLMESITLMQKRAKTISVPIHYHTQMKHLISR